MKIQHLYIENIASIEKAEIDFETGPLASDPLFLISGDTGSGKTTILNAICLALYNDVSAIAMIGSSDKDNEGLKTTNTRQLMRKGAGYCCVRLKFIGNDEKHYEASWEVQRAYKKADGNLQNIVRQFRIVEDNIAYTNAKDIDNEVKRSVGLTFEQFNRTTMLAQGQFATFMKASDNDKSDILEKLTGTEIYAQIGAKVNQLFKTKDDEVKRLDAIIKGANLLPEETKKEYAESIQQYVQKLSELDKNIKTVSAQLEWLDQEKKLSNQIIELKHNLSVATESMESEENLQHKTWIQQWDETTDVRRSIANEKTTRQHIKELDEKMLALSGKSWHRVLDGLQWLNCELLKKNEASDLLAAKVMQQEGEKEMYENAQRIDEKGKNVVKYIQDSDKYQREAERKATEAENSKRAEIPLEQALEKAKAIVEAAKKDVDVKESATKNYNIKIISDSLSETLNSIQKYRNAISALNEYNRTVEAEETSRKQCEKLDTDIAETKKSLIDITQQIGPANEENTRLKAYYEGQKELNDHIVSLRNTFADTHECPLCGNKNIHLHSDDEINSKLKEAKDAANKAYNNLVEIHKNEAILKATLELHLRNKKKAESSHKTDVEALKRALSSLESLKIEFHEDGCLEKLNSKVEELENVKEKQNLLLSEAQTQIEDLQKAQKILEESRQAVDTSTKKLEDQQRKSMNLIEDSERYKNQSAEATANAETTLTELNEYLISEKATLDNVMEISKEIIHRAQKYENDKNFLAQTKREVEELTKRLENCKDDVAKLSSRFCSDYAPKAIELKDLEASIRRLCGDVDRLDGEIDTQKSICQGLQESIESYFANSPLSRHDIDVLTAIGLEQIELYRNRVKSLEESVAKARHELGIVAGQLENHINLRPEIDEGDTLDSLKLMKSNIEAERDAVNNQKVKLETLLINDQENVAKQADNYRRLEVLSEERNNWSTLNNIFGGNEGIQFKRIAQSYVLRALLAKANYYLAMFSKRYLLDCEDGSLTINVIDANQGGVARNVGFISGGEGFVVSLALALGLSSISNTQINVDTLFIDEGFGTLDNETLETVINTLDRLHDLGGRRIGIISHKEELKQRIPTQIRLERTGPSSSKVIVISQ